MTKQVWGIALGVTILNGSFFLYQLKEKQQAADEAIKYFHMSVECLCQDPFNIGVKPAVKRSSQPPIVSMRGGD